MEIPRSVLGALRKLMPRWSGDISACEYLSGGFSNNNYRITYAGEDYVLRIPIGAQEHGSGNEWRFRSKLDRNTRLITSPLVAQRANEGLLLTRFCAGNLLAEQPPQRPQALDYVRNLGQQLRSVEHGETYDLRSLVSAWLPTPEPWLERWLQRPQSLAGSSLAPQCCHNDLNPWNVIGVGADPRQWITIDWETAAVNDPLFDVVTFYEGLRELPTFKAGGTLGEFCRAIFGRDLSDAEIRATQRKFWLREFAWATDQMMRGNASDEVANQVVVAKRRLQRLLA